MGKRESSLVIQRTFKFKQQITEVKPVAITTSKLVDRSLGIKLETVFPIFAQRVRIMH